MNFKKQKISICEAQNWSNA